MGRRKSAAEKAPKRKAVKIRMALRMNAGRVIEPYQIMEDRIASHRPDLKDLKIGIAWHAGWRPDADGIVTHGKAIKRTDLDRSLDDCDAVIEINEKTWSAFDDRQKRRLIAHELEHIQIAKDRNGHDLMDDKNRLVIRMKRHNIADFKSILDEFGTEVEPTETEIADSNRPLIQMAEAKSRESPQPEPFAEDPNPKSSIINHQSQMNPAAGSPDAYCIPIMGTKRMGLIAEIRLTRDGNSWKAEWSIEAGRNSRPVQPRDALNQYATSQIAAEAACKDIVTWLGEIPEKQYDFTGAAQGRVKHAVAKWIGENGEK